MSEGMFPQHTRSGPWETLKGSMLQPHEAGPIEGHNQDNVRQQNGSMTGHWDSDVIVTTGKTGGGGTMLK
jgi:hypothetical protein